jgi:hypothetical protein
MGSFLTKCWEARPNRNTYTQLKRLLVRNQVSTTRALNENDYLTMSTFAAADEVIALNEFAAIVEPRPLDQHDHAANNLMCDKVIREQLGL